MTEKNTLNIWAIMKKTTYKKLKETVYVID